MAISLASLHRSGAPQPPRLLVYGVAGVGKTKLATDAPAPVFLQTEDGLGKLGAATFGVLRSYADVQDALDVLLEQPHDFQTVVVDSLDWLEPLIWRETAARNKWTDIETPGYGKGYAAALDVWRGFLDGMTLLRDDRGMAVILIAHADIKRFDSPETEPYDRYQPKLHSRAAALVQEHVDAVLFANYRVSTIRSDAGFGKKVARSARPRLRADVRAGAPGGAAQAPRCGRRARPRRAPAPGQCSRGVEAIMSGSTRVASIRLSTEDLDAARAKMEALGSLGDQVLERITQAGHRATAAVSGIADGGDAYTRRAADIAAYGVELDRLRGKFDPLFAASKRYEATLEEIAYAERVGAINAGVAARARDATTKAFADAVAPTGVAAATTAVLAGKTAEAAQQHENLTISAGASAFALRQLGVQTMQAVSSIAAGQPVMMTMIQQGHQVADVAISTGTGFGILGTAARMVAGALLSPIGAAVAVGGALALAMAHASALETEARQLSVALRAVVRNRNSGDAHDRTLPHYRQGHRPRPSGRAQDDANRGFEAAVAHAVRHRATAVQQDLHPEPAWVSHPGVGLWRPEAGDGGPPRGAGRAARRRQYRPAPHPP